MKLRKHLGRRVFALFLVLLLSFNSLTVFAEDKPVNTGTPAAVETMEVTDSADDAEISAQMQTVKEETAEEGETKAGNPVESVKEADTGNPVENLEAQVEEKDRGADDSLNSETAAKIEQSGTQQLGTEQSETELTGTEAETGSSETDIQDKEPAVNEQKNEPVTEEQKTADADEAVQEEAEVSAESVQEETVAVDGEAETATPEYATLDELNAAVESMGDAEDEEAVCAVLAECLRIYERLSDADKDVMAEAYAAILSYAEDFGQSEIETLGLATGHYLKVTVQKVYKTSAGTYKEYQGSDTAYIYCTDGTGHSGYNHGINVSDFWPANFGWSTGDDWLGWAKGSYWPGSYNNKWNSGQNPTTTINASVTGREPYKASQYIYLVYKEPVPTYTITYLNGYGGTVQVYNNVSKGTNTPKPANPSRAGYTFDGWTPSVAATVTGDATYTAKWKQDQTYYAQILYNANADGETVSGMPGQGFYSGQNQSPIYSLSKNVPTRTGYTFKGWATTKDSKTPVSSITLTTSTSSPGSINRVYAIWEKTVLFTIVKQFKGISEEEVPDNFQLLVIDGNSNVKQLSLTDPEVVNLGTAYVWTINNVPAGKTITVIESGYKLSDDSEYTWKEATTTSANATVTQDGVTFTVIPDKTADSVSFGIINTYSKDDAKDDKKGIELEKNRTTKLGDSSAPAQVGDTITWDIKVTNTSKTSVRHVTLTDNAMENVTLEYNGQKGNGTLKVEVPANTTITVKATHVLTEADYEKAKQNSLNRVYNSVSGVCDETVEGNPAGSATDNGTKIGVPKLTIVKKAQPETAKPGEEVVYTITVTNTSKLDAKNVTVTDILPAGVTLVSATLNGGKVTPVNGVYQIGRIAANVGKAELKITAKVDETAVPGISIVNTATADFENREGELPGGSATVTITEPDNPKDESTTLSVTKTADKTELKPGDEVEYTITVRNTGANAAKDVTVTDKLDGSLTFISATLTVNGSERNVTLDANGKYTIGEIAKDGEAVLKITAKVSETLDTEAVKSIKNVATAGYDNKPEEPTNPDDPDSPKEPIEDPKGEVETPVNPEEPENPDNPDNPENPDTTYTVTWVSGYDDTVYQTENDLKREEIADNHPENPVREGYTFTGWNVGEPDAEGNIVVTAQWSQNEPSEPTDPEGPTDPETPTEPTEPEGPIDPENPTPGTPEEPTPGTPDDPTPGTPEEPTPGTPDDPTPGTPDEPAAEEQPVTPPVPAPVPVTTTPAAATPVAVQIVPVEPTPVDPAPATPVAENEPAAPEEEVTLPEETVPAAEPVEEPETVNIGDEEVPMAEFGGKGSPAWALLNLILTILTTLVSLLLLTFYFTGKRKEDEDEERVRRNTEDEDEEELKRKGLIRLLSILPAVFAVITFILTEDMRNPMIIVDRWTILMLLYAVVNVVLAVFAIKKREEKEEEEVVK